MFGLASEPVLVKVTEPADAPEIAISLPASGKPETVTLPSAVTEVTWKALLSAAAAVADISATTENVLTPLTAKAREVKVTSWLEELTERPEVKRVPPS